MKPSNKFEFRSFALFLRCRWGEIHRRKKAFCFKSKSVKSPNLNGGPKRSMLILCCIYRLCAFCVLPTYIFTAWEYCFFTVHFRYGVWRYLQIDGRKATSLTSFLFLYPLLTAIVRRLEWRKKVLLS